MESQKRPVLLLIPSKLLKEAVLRYIKNGGDIYKRYDFTLMADDDLNPFTLIALYDEVAGKIRASPVLPLVIPVHDTGALVHAALAQEFPHIIAPTILSEFIALHKGETYKMAPSECVMPTFQLTAEADICLKDLFDAGLEKFPMFVKPSMGSNSALVGKIANMEKLRRFLFQGRLLVPEISAGVEKFVSKFLTEFYLQGSIRNVWIIQPFVECRENGHLCCTDGLVFNKEITIWDTHEFVFWEGAPTVLKCLSSPASLETAAMSNLLKAYEHIISEMIAHGLNNQFASLEAFVMNNGKIHITEFNARSVRVHWRSYQAVNKQTGDCLSALLSMAEGVKPEKPVSDPSVHACTSYVSVFGEGKAKEFIDLDKARNMDQFDLRCDEDTDVSCKGEWGYQVAYCYTYGLSRVEAIQEAGRLIAEVVTTKEACPWLTC